MSETSNISTSSIEARLNQLTEHHRKVMEQRAAFQNNLNAATQQAILLEGQIAETQFWLGELGQTQQMESAPPTTASE